MSFVHLHLHSQYSLLDGAITVEGMLDRAKKTDMPAVALTDHGNLYGALEFYQKAQKAEVKPIIGIEGYITQGDRRDKSHKFPTNHIVLLAANNEGLKNLFRLVTLSNFEGYYYKPRMDRKILRKYSKGIIGLSACLSGVPAKHISEGRMDLAEASIRDYQDIFGHENYYLELMETGMSEQTTVNNGLIDLSKRLSMPLVATNDCHYLNREDTKAHDLLLCIGTGKKVDDQDRMKFSTHEFYMKTPEEMQSMFSHLPEALSNTVEIAKKCNVDINLKDYHMPVFDLPKDMDAQECLRDMAKKGLEQRMGQIKAFYQNQGRKIEKLQDVYHERLEDELKVIDKTGFAGYFLIVQDFINYAKNNAIPVGPGRGSAAGSLVAYATNITDVDPLPYNLLFERFLNKERISMPDIDVDFCQEGREKVIDYVAQKYGGEGESLEDAKVAQITTFGKMQARAAIRDVGRAMGMSYGEVDRIAKLVPNVLGITLKQSFEQEAKFDELRKRDPKVDELLEIAVALEGLTRHASVHAAGVVISDENPLVDHLPLTKGQHGEVVTQWDMKGVEKVGLVKFDFLGLKTLTLLQRATDLIKQTQNKEIDLLDINQNEPKVFEMLCRGETQGVFQLESSGMRELVVRLKPSSFEDIIALVALYRPGPLGSGMVDDFINRKHGLTKVVYDFPQLEWILKDTYGVILYQEQVMQIASELASYTLGEADLLRRAMGKKIESEMQVQEQRFMEGARKNKLDERKAKKVFDLMAKFAGYGFNKSHSAAYGLISYQTAFVKAQYPKEFMAACLSIDRNNTDRVVSHMNECRNLDIEVLPPDVNESALDFSVHADKIRFGLGAVKGIGEQPIAAIEQARADGGKFEDLLDFCMRVDQKHVNKRVLEALIKCGAFDGWGTKRAALMASFERATALASSAQKDRIIGQNSLFGDTGLAQPAFEYPQVEEWEEGERLRLEREALGFYISGHPLMKFDEITKRYGNANTASLLDLSDKSTARISGVISSLKEITTRKGDRMAFASLEDLHGRVELIVFPKTYKSTIELLKSDQPIFVKGNVDIGEEQAKILVNQIVPLEEASSLYDGSLHIDLYAERCGENTMENVKSLFADYAGDCPVSISVHIKERSVTRIAVSNKMQVAASPSFLSELKRILGNAGTMKLR